GAERRGIRVSGHSRDRPRHPYPGRRARDTRSEERAHERDHGGPRHRTRCDRRGGLRRPDGGVPRTGRERPRLEGWRQRVARRRRKRSRRGTSLRRRCHDDADQSDRGDRPLPRGHVRIGSWTSTPKAYYASAGFAARWGGDEGNLGREVSTEEPRRRRRPGRNRRAPQGVREGGEPAPPALRGPGGHRQDDVCYRPRARYVRRELAAELLRAE